MDGILTNRWWVVFATAAVVLIVIGLCWRPRPVAYDCPDHEIKLPPVHEGDTAWSTVPLAGNTAQIPEFHDCQRLISQSNGKKYGALIGIWVSEKLDRLPDSLAKLATLIPDREYPVLLVPKSVPAYQPLPLTQKGVGLAFAQIYAWPEPPGGEQGY